MTRPDASNRRQRLLTQLRLLGTGVLLVVVAALLALLSQRHAWQADWTADGRNTLSPASEAVLPQYDTAPEINVFAHDDAAQREPIRRLLGPYERALPALEVRFINPDLAPDQVREQGIREAGTLLIHYDGRTERVTEHTERALTNALQRLLHADDRYLVFLAGHGERAPHGEAGRDLGDFTAKLTRKGINVQTLNLAEHGVIPDNTTALVLASPRHGLLPDEVELIRRYVADGGHLIWLAEPAMPDGLEPLADDLGLAFAPGVIVDPATRARGLDHPAAVVVTDYPEHPALAGIEANTVWPFATGVSTEDSGNGWDRTVLFSSSERSWAQTGPLEGTLEYDPDVDVAGPLDFGLALSRPLDGMPDAGMQRILVLGTGHFIANAFLGAGANLDLGVALFRWALADDELVHIPARSAPDSRFELSDGALYGIGFGFLFGIPIMLLVTGVTVWAYRRRQ